MFAPLTSRQTEVLDYIRDTHKRRGYPPTVRDIGEALGMRSPSTVHFHLNALIEKGWLRREPGKPRAIQIIEEVT